MIQDVRAALERPFTASHRAARPSLLSVLPTTLSCDGYVWTDLVGLLLLRLLLLLLLLWLLLPALRTFATGPRLADRIIEHLLQGS